MTITDIYEARKCLQNIIRKTPLINSGISDKCNLFLKPENLQLTGSYKIRGAYNKISRLTDAEKQQGIIACSAGNHAQGVAYSAQKLGIHAVICMPESAPQVKVEATHKMGAEIVLVPGTFDDAYQRSLELQKECGYTFIHPFDDETIIAGQGTIGLEIMEELPDADVIICPVGGGGLISGIAIAAKTINPEIKVYGVQSSGAPSMYASMAGGYIAQLSRMNTIADGIAVGKVGGLTFNYARQYVDDIFVVSDGKIAKAIKVLMTAEKLVAEGAGAAPLAALLAGYIPGIEKDKKVVCVISGGNIDIPLLAKLTTWEIG